MVESNGGVKWSRGSGWRGNPATRKLAGGGGLGAIGERETYVRSEVDMVAGFGVFEVGLEMG